MTELSSKQTYLGWLWNASNVLIKPRNHAHMIALMKGESQWKVDPVTGEAIQTGFRFATQAEIDSQLEKWAAENDTMMRQEAQELRRKAPVIIMANSEDDAHEVRAGRKSGRKISKDSE